MKGWGGLGCSGTCRGGVGGSYKVGSWVRWVIQRWDGMGHAKY